jgi:hypothetical protein
MPYLKKKAFRTNQIQKEQKRQLFKEGQKAVQDVRKSLAPKVQQLGPSKRAKLTVTKEVLAKRQPSTNTLNRKKKAKKKSK